MKLEHQGVSYDYTPPAVTYPDKATVLSSRAQARYLIAAHRKHNKDRRQSLLIRSFAESSIVA